MVTCSFGGMCRIETYPQLIEAQRADDQINIRDYLGEIHHHAHDVRSRRTACEAVYAVGDKHYRKHEQHPAVLRHEPVHLGAVTRLGRDSLEEIASELRLEYIHMEEVKDISTLTENIITDAQYEAQLREDTKNKKDTYFYLIPVLMMLLIGENLLFRR